VEGFEQRVSVMTAPGRAVTFCTIWAFCENWSQVTVTLTGSGAGGVGDVVAAGAQARNVITRADMTINKATRDFFIVAILLKYNWPMLNHCRLKLHPFQAD